MAHLMIFATLFGSPHKVLPPAARFDVASLATALLVLALGCSSPPPSPAPAPGAPAPQRVVCLTPSSTELVAALGAVALVVGVDEYSRYPREVHGLPKVGDFVAPNLEAILALHPDIVVADSAQKQIAPRLQQAKITTLFVDMQTIGDVRAALLEVGRALARKPAAEAAILLLDRALSDAAGRASAGVARTGRRPRVLFVVDRQAGGLASVVAAGPGSYLDELLTLAGGDNVLADAPMRYVPITAEVIVARAPEVLLDASHVEDPARARDDWSVLASVPAVATGRVYLLDDAAAVTPGPRLGAVLARLVDLLWGPPAPG